MSRLIPTRTGAIALLGALALLTAAGPAAAQTPLGATEDVTSIACDTVIAEGGVIRFTASLSSLYGPAGYLIYWGPTEDPAFGQPTLASQDLDVSIGPDGSISVSYEMWTIGDLGFEAEGEPVFVGTAELDAIVTAGHLEEIVERNQNGNSRFVLRGALQELAVGSGEADVPTGGTFDLTGADCTGSREVLTTFVTQPDALVSTGQLIELDCFIETADGFVVVNAQAGNTYEFFGILVVDATGVYFGEATDPDIWLHGAEATVPLPMDGDPSVTGSAEASARFDVVERAKGRYDTPDGWASETAYLLSVEGTLTFDAPGVSLELAMDGCSAFAQVGMSQGR